jgi:cellobiose-specific phosphotransferase system component IIA
MTEKASAEVERVLLHLGDARTRAQRAIERLEKSGVETQATAVLRETEQALDELSRQLKQRTYYAVDSAETIKLVV